MQKPNNMEQRSYRMKYAEDLMDILEKKHYFIAAVQINSDGILRNKPGGIGHWVVLTGFSSQWDYSNLDSKRNWVRINNPLNNMQPEYYLWSEYRRSSSPGIGLELWQENIPLETRYNMVR